MIRLAPGETLFESAREGVTMAKRIVPDRCVGAIVDVQEFFLAQLEKRTGAKIRTNTRNFARLLGYFRVPIIVTLERPVDRKGSLPRDIKRGLNDSAETFHKSFFDLTREKKVADHLGRLKRKQVVVAGCETDVCILQSCLGLLDLGYEVFLVEELLFSSARNVEAAIDRMKAAGAVFLSYKTLYYELLQAVAGEPRIDKLLERLGPFPDDLPDSAI